MEVENQCDSKNLQYLVVLRPKRLKEPQQVLLVFKNLNQLRPRLPRSIPPPLKTESDKISHLAGAVIEPLLETALV
jgi:hypothetical protein